MKKLIALAAVLFTAGILSAQTADFVTEMLGAKSANYGQVSYLAAVYQGIVPETADYPTAFAALQEKGQLPEDAEISASVDMQHLSYIFTRVYNVGGGFMYRITKGNMRYSFRQLKADGVLVQKTDPRKTASGTDVMNLYTDCERVYGEQEAAK